MLEKLGIDIVRLRLPFRLDHVNCLLAEGENGWSIIDTGLNDRRTRATWKDVFAKKELTNIYVSHYHPDHFGYAGQLQQETNATVFMTEEDEFSAKTVWEKSFIQVIRENYAMYGVPDGTANEMTENTEGFLKVITPYPNVTKHMTEGDKIVFGKEEYEIIQAPGHADGLVVFYNEAKNVLLSTDHILPDITPNVSYWFHGLENPLQAYKDSLVKIKKLNVEFVIPSHGEPFFDANGRIDEILRHHDERIEFVLDQVDKETTAYLMSENLFTFEMDTHEKRFALGESIAHLEYLVVKGYMKKELSDGIWTYYVI